MRVGLARARYHMMEFILIERIEPVEAWVKPFGIVLMAIFINACGAAEIVPYGQPQASVRLVSNGNYMFNYSMDEVGLHVPDRNSAAESYLRQHPWILPPDCGQGIRILRGGDSQTGGGWILFECNKSE